jgi:hypothetical protein
MTQQKESRVAEEFEASPDRRGPHAFRLDGAHTAVGYDH